MKAHFVYLNVGILFVCVLANAEVFAFGARPPSQSSNAASTNNSPLISNYSDVGYRRGNHSIPHKPADISYPAGRFEITDKIILQKGQVLRGAGRGKTILYFSKPLVGMGYSCSMSVDAHDCWDWDGGVIEVNNGMESGIENITIEFPPHPYSHHDGQGYNGILCRNCRHSWIKNVEIINADVGILVASGHHNTIRDVSIKGGNHLHIGLVSTTKNLVINFDVSGNTLHGLTGNWGGERNVFSNGDGDNIVMEPNHAHSNQPQTKDYLYTNIRGRSRKIQGGNGGSTGGAIFWNVAESRYNPVDAYVEQMRVIKQVDPRK